MVKRVPRVSVIIPAYNASRFIPGAIDSVTEQDYPEFEIICVNDGSADDTEKVLKRYADAEKIKSLTIKNGGVSHAINAGLDKAEGDYVCILHADDRFLQGKLEKQVRTLERLRQCSVSYTDESYFVEGGDSVMKSPYAHFSGDIFYFLKRNNFIHVSTAMFRSPVIKSARFDTGLACHEDWDLFLRLARSGTRFAYIDETLSAICVHPENLTNDTGVMDETRSIVGGRAKELWRDFKGCIDLHSKAGLSNLGRYVSFKARAEIIGFPNSRKFQAVSPFAAQR